MHTPGPWASEVALSSDFHHIRYVTADGRIIASVLYRKEQTLDEALANARLIAKAPAMLDVLRRVADFWAGGDVPAELDRDIRALLED